MSFTFPNNNSNIQYMEYSDQPITTDGQIEIDLDEIQRRSIINNHDLPPLPPKDEVQVNQIEIPDIDDQASADNNISGFSFPQKPTPGGQAKRHEKPQQSLSLNTNNTLEIRKQLATDVKIPTEYTLHMIFTQFIRLAERKLNSSEISEENISNKFIASLKHGHDANFDKVVTSLGYIARKNPQQVIDSVMYWRKSKAEMLEVTITAYNKNKHLLMLKQKQLRGQTHGSSSSSKISLHSRNTSNQSNISYSNAELNPGDNMSLQFLENQVENARQVYVLAENKANVANFLVSRVLIEVVKQIPLNSKNMQVYNVLEDSVYHQLKSMDPATIMNVKIKLVNWNSVTTLLGYISKKRFSKISDKFIADLEKIPTNVAKNDEVYIFLLINGMKRLKLSNYPLDDFEESCGFLSSLAKFFYKSKNDMLINSYSETLSELLLPFCGVLNAETDLPVWIEVIKLMLKKINIIIDKQKYWDNAFTLMCVCLSVAPANIFYDNWFDLIEYNLNNRLNKAGFIKELGDYNSMSAVLNEKKLSRVNSNSKIVLLKSITRLTWTYVFRCTESLNKTTKKLDLLFKLMFFQSTTSKKQQWINYDIELIKPLIVLIRSIGSSNINYTMESIVIPLIRLSFNTYNLENLSIERLIIIVNSYIFILDDMINNRRPAFPTNEVIDSALEFPSTNFNNTNINEILKSRNINENDILYHEEISNYFCKLFLLLDQDIGALSWNNTSAQTVSNENNPVASPSFLSNKSPFSSFHYFSSESNVNKKLLSLDLFDKLLESIPWFYQISNVIPYNTLIEILIRNSIHEVPRISHTCINTLKKLCNKKNPGTLIALFSKIAFQFNEDNSSNLRYNSSFLTSHSEVYQKLIKIYCELILCWLNFLKNKVNPEKATKEEDDFYILNGNFRMNMEKKIDKGENPDIDEKEDLVFSSITPIIDQLEGNGLFFLCSRSTSIRRLAVGILRLIPKFDEVINKSGEDESRLIHLLESINFFDLLAVSKVQLNMPERKRLSSLKTKNKNQLLLKLAESDNGVELTLWFKTFPKLVTMLFEKSPITMALCRQIVCIRLIQMHGYVNKFAETKGRINELTSKLYFNGSSNNSSSTNNSLTVQPEILIEQWKLFLIVACACTSNDDKQKSSVNTINSARSIFKLVLPLLSTEQNLVRDAIISGLSCVNINIFKALIESVQPIRQNWETEIKAGSINEKNMRVRIEITRVLVATSKYLTDPLIYNDSRILIEMISYIKTVRSFLGIPKIQESFEYQKLRRYFCGLLENVFLGIQKTDSPDKWFPFEARLGCFTYLEEWCGYGISAHQAKQRYVIMKQNQKNNNLATLNAALELEKTALEYSAISSMATLCSGAINQTIKGNKTYVVMAIDYSSLISWIKALFESNDDLLHKLGKRGLKSLLASNQDKRIFDLAVKESFICRENPKTCQSYFTAIAETLLENKEYKCEPCEVIVLSLFAACSTNLEIRKLAGELLLYIDNDAALGGLKLLVESLAVSSKYVYKKASLQISEMFAKSYFKDKYSIISLFSLYLPTVEESYRKDILTLMLPWLSTVKLVRGDYNKNYKAAQDAFSEMILNNLIEITDKYGENYYEEVENLWKHLVSNSPENNSITILDYLYSICLNRRNSQLVECCKQIVSHLGVSYPNITKVIINNINPKAMIPPEIKPIEASKNPKNFPYLHSLPEKDDKDLLSQGQVSIIFLVDLVRAQGLDSLTTNLPLLLNISIVLVDHYLPIVKLHASQLLVSLISELSEDKELAKQILSDLHDVKYLWSYDDLNNDRNGTQTPANMDKLIKALLQLFDQIPSLQQDWSRMALTWATTCSVRHIACRSFQAFRSLLLFLDQGMLRDMLHRLSNTIADPSADIQGFAMQILMSIDTITTELSAEQLIAFPQLFWFAVACSSTVLEKEYIESVSIISKFISKIDVNSPDTISCLISTFPPTWEGKFEGLQNILTDGLKSANAWEPCLNLLDRLNSLQSNKIINGDTRMLLALLANMPRFLHAFELKDFSPEIKNAAEILSNMAISLEQPALSRIVLSLANNKFRKKEDFISQVLLVIKKLYFPKHQFSSLTFLFGLLFNKISWVKLETLDLLKYLLPLIDFSREEFQGVGADLLSPLLRLLITEFSEKALEVLDETDEISGSQLDKDFIRLSLGNKTLRKEYEKIATLFGVPEESGWSVPMPLVTAATTRNNVHAVYLTCQNSQEVMPKEDNIEFLKDQREEQVHQQKQETHEKRSISNMYATLNYFETFFDADADGRPREDEHNRSMSTETSRTTNYGLDRTESNLSYRLDTFNSNNFSNYYNY